LNTPSKADIEPKQTSTDSAHRLKCSKYGSQNLPDDLNLFERPKEAQMLTSRARQELSAWSTRSSLVTLGLPPNDPDDEDKDEEDEDEGEEEPAVVRGPDE
jgi:hypothetical protein